MYELSTVKVLSVLVTYLILS